MQIVINIPEEYRDYIKRNYNFKNKDDYNAVVMAIVNGTPLPKGHGRLIDADKLTESILCKTFGLRSVDIENAPTIIEADKAESEDKG